MSRGGNAGCCFVGDSGVLWYILHAMHSQGIQQAAISLRMILKFPTLSRDFV
jgi:hypothetical protein